MRKLHVSQRGDTIVEVLICLAVLSGLLVFTFATARRHGNATRLAQERVEALKIAESQAESLKSYVGGAQDATGIFCLHIESGGVNKYTFPAGYTYAEDPAADVFASYGAAAGPVATKNCVLLDRYHVLVAKDPASTDVNQYLIQVRWEKLGGSTVEQLKIRYKAYPL